MKRRRVEDVFWNLASLVSDYVLELPASRLSVGALRAGPRPGTRVCVPVAGRALPEIAAVTAEVAAAGMRPVLVAPVPRPTGAAVRMVRELTGIGARDLVLRWPATTATADALDGAVRLAAECGLGERGLRELGIWAGGLVRREAEPSADLLRAFDGVHDAGPRHGVGFTLLAPPVRAAESIVAWERVLRAAGNRIPIRLRLPGVTQNPLRRTGQLLLDLAAAVESDPDSMLIDLQFVVRGAPARTTAFADEICRGNFVVEETASGYRLSLLT